MADGQPGLVCYHIVLETAVLCKLLQDNYTNCWNKNHLISSLIFVSYYMVNLFWRARGCHLLCQGPGIQHWDLSKCVET